MNETRNSSLPEEHICTITLRGTTAATLICTPEKLDYLAVGWAWAQGIAIDARTPVTVEREGARSGAHIDVDAPGSFPWHTYAAAGFDAGYLVQTSSVRLPDRTGMDAGLFEQQLQAAFDLFRQHRGAGGFHHAALVDETDIRALATDISRHNAVDKVVGQAIRDDIDRAQSAIILSGRISADIALKGARAGAPIIATRSLPTRQAVALADEAGLMLVCRALDHRRAVYGPRRLV